MLRVKQCVNGHSDSQLLMAWLYEGYRSAQTGADKRELKGPTLSVW
jgi:hypothetical protein